MRENKDKQNKKILVMKQYCSTKTHRFAYCNFSFGVEREREREREGERERERPLLPIYKLIMWANHESNISLSKHDLSS